MQVLLNKKLSAPTQNAYENHSGRDNACGFFGTVTEVHPETNSVFVRTDTGFVIPRVRVACLSEWVTYNEDKQLTGERHLPPKDSYVFCLMPNGDFASAFVLCSVFSAYDEEHRPFMERSGDEDKITIAKNHRSILSQGQWRFEENYVTGTRRMYNAPKQDDATISIEVLQTNPDDSKKEEKNENPKTTVKVYGTTICVTQGKDDEPPTVELTTLNDTTLSIKGGKEEKDRKIELKTALKNTNLSLDNNTLKFSTESAVEISTDSDVTKTFNGNETKTINGKKETSIKGDSLLTSDGRIEQTAGKTIKLGNQQATLGNLFSELCDVLKSLSVVDPISGDIPASSGFSLAIESFCAKVKEVFE